MANSGARGGLLRTGIVSVVDSEKHVEQKAMMQAAQQLRMPPVQPSMCRLPTEFMVPLQDDDDTDTTHHTASSALPSSAAQNVLLPDLGFATLQQQQTQQQQQLPVQTNTWRRRSEETNSNIYDSPRLGGGRVADGGGGFLSRAQIDREGGWQWSGGGVGGSPIKKGAAGAASEYHILIFPSACLSVCLSVRLSVCP